MKIRAQGRLLSKRKIPLKKIPAKKDPPGIPKETGRIFFVLTIRFQLTNSEISFVKKILCKGILTLNIWCCIIKYIILYNGMKCYKF